MPASATAPKPSLSIELIQDSLMKLGDNSSKEISKQLAVLKENQAEITLAELHDALEKVGLNGNHASLVWAMTKGQTDKVKVAKETRKKETAETTKNFKAMAVPLTGALGGEFTEIKGKLAQSAIDLTMKHSANFAEILTHTSESVKGLKAEEISQEEMINDLEAFQKLAGEKETKKEVLLEAFDNLQNATKVLLHKNISLTSVAYLANSEGKEEGAPKGLINSLKALKRKSTEKDPKIHTLASGIEMLVSEGSNESFDFQKHGTEAFKESYQEFSVRFANYTNLYNKNEIDEKTYFSEIQDLAKDYSKEHLEILRSSVSAISNEQSESFVQSISSKFGKIKDYYKYILLIPAFFQTMKGLFNCVRTGNITGGLSAAGSAVEKFALPLLAVNSMESGEASDKVTQAVGETHNNFANSLFS